MTRHLQTTLAAFTAALAVVGATVAVAATPGVLPDSADHLAAALVAPAGNTTSVQVEVLNLDTTRHGEMVLVAVEGGDGIARLERASLVRQQLAALGLTPQQVFIEGAAED